jgi:hypothetical protein
MWFLMREFTELTPCMLSWNLAVRLTVTLELVEANCCWEELLGASWLGLWQFKEDCYCY